MIPTGYQQAYRDWLRTYIEANGHPGATNIEAFIAGWNAAHETATRSICEAERDRIIALLDNYTMYRFEKELVIALIKGEN